jgi:hypothetical protein
MSPRRPSSSRRIERRIPSRDTSIRPVLRTGIWTRRPSVVRATTTWRRSRPSNRANAYSGCVTISVCCCPRVPRSLSVERRPSTSPRRSRWPAGRWSHAASQRGEETRRAKGNDRRWSAVVLDHSGPEGTSVRSLPAVSGGGSHRRVRTRVDVAAVVARHRQDHLTPAPRLMAIDARSVNATVKRARFALTSTTSCYECRISASAAGRSGCLSAAQIPGFASPSRDGFALDECADGRTFAFNDQARTSGPNDP